MARTKDRYVIRCLERHFDMKEGFEGLEAYVVRDPTALSGFRVDCGSPFEWNRNPERWPTVFAKREDAEAVVANFLSARTTYGWSASKPEIVAVKPRFDRVQSGWIKT